MPTSTYDLIASNVLGSDASSVTFSSIPATYRDLVLVCNITRSGANNVNMRFNADNGANYNRVVMTGNGTSASSGSTANASTAPISSSSIVSPFITVQILDYSATDKHKTFLARTNEASVETDARATRWASTSAINAIQVYASNNFLAGSSFYLYGIVS